MDDTRPTDDYVGGSTAPSITIRSGTRDAAEDLTARLGSRILALLWLDRVRSSVEARIRPDEIPDTSLDDLTDAIERVTARRPADMRPVWRVGRRGAWWAEPTEVAWRTYMTHHGARQAARRWSAAGYDVTVQRAQVTPWEDTSL